MDEKDYWGEPGELEIDSESAKIIKDHLTEKGLHMSGDNLNRFGDCPNCKTSWDNGDIFDYLNRLDVFFNKPKDDIAKVATNYGWTPENKKRFSLVKTTEINSIVLLECPKCHHVFEAETSKQYESLYQAKEALNATI